MHGRHITIEFKDFHSPVQNDSRCDVYWKHRRRAQKIVIQPHNVSITIQTMTKPCQKPGQSKHGTDRRPKKS